VQCWHRHWLFEVPRAFGSRAGRAAPPSESGTARRVAEQLVRAAFAMLLRQKLEC
jgi:hypothetical protein